MSEIVKNHNQIGTRAVVAETINEMPQKKDIGVGELYPLDSTVGNEKTK